LSAKGASASVRPCRLTRRETAVRRHEDKAVAYAFGVDLRLAELLAIDMAASALAGLLPVPGGIGAAQAAITAGLVAMGVDESTAFAVAFTHRLCT
jgi:uncharacterized membrane protein YbhN (UPF0104 family)